MIETSNVLSDRLSINLCPKVFPLDKLIGGDIPPRPVNFAAIFNLPHTFFPSFLWCLAQPTYHFPVALPTSHTHHTMLHRSQKEEAAMRPTNIFFWYFR